MNLDLKERGFIRARKFLAYIKTIVKEPGDKDCTCESVTEFHMIGCKGVKKPPKF